MHENVTPVEDSSLSVTQSRTRAIPLSRILRLQACRVARKRCPYRRFVAFKCYPHTKATPLPRILCLQAPQEAMASQSQSWDSNSKAVPSHEHLLQRASMASQSQSRNRPSRAQANVSGESMSKLKPGIQSFRHPDIYHGEPKSRLGFKFQSRPIA